MIRATSLDAKRALGYFLGFRIFAGWLRGTSLDAKHALGYLLGFRIFAAWLRGTSLDAKRALGYLLGFRIFAGRLGYTIKFLGRKALGCLIWGKFLRLKLWRHDDFAS